MFSVRYSALSASEIMSCQRSSHVSAQRSHANSYELCRQSVLVLAISTLIASVTIGMRNELAFPKIGGYLAVDQYNVMIGDRQSVMYVVGD